MMNASRGRRLPVLLLLLTFIGIAGAQADLSGGPPDTAPARHQWTHHTRDHTGIHGDEDRVNVGSDSHLAAGDHADSVVSILGSAISDGEAEDVVSVLGHTRVTGPVRDSAVAVFGDVFVDSKVEGDVVAVLGDVELGPHAEVAGDVVAIGGALKRDPEAIIHGDAQSLFNTHGGFVWLRPWLRYCLLYGRPLALVPGVAWAWLVTLSCLAVYLVLGLLFGPSMQRCVRTFESKPGQSFLAALLSVLAVPILIALLCITVIGVVALPFLGFGLLMAVLFGKAVMLMWLGQRCLGTREMGGLNHPSVAVLVGGTIVLVLYVVPILGLIVYQLLGLLGLGVLALTLIQQVRPKSPAPGTAPGAEPAVAGGSGAAALSAAAPVGTTTTDSISAEPLNSAGTAAAPSNAAATAPYGAAVLPHAGFWIRMLALTLDLLLIVILIHALHHFDDMALLVLAAYGAVMWKLRGATIGGIVFDMQVVRVDGRAVDWGTAIVRALSCFLSLAAVGLGFFWIAFDREKQAWHDKIAGTIVVRTSKRVSLV